MIAHGKALLFMILLLSHGLSLPSTAGATEHATIAPIVACGELASVDLTSIGGAGSKITQALETVNAAGVTACTVTGTLAPAIGFAVILPTKTWTQRYLQLGCGGLCGSVNLQLAAGAGCVPYEAGGFVVAATDMGHQGLDPSFGQDPQKRTDFAWRGQHLTTQAAKTLVAAYYGQAPRYSYFSGCSDGGREALMTAQRFPDDFDGIIAGAPAANFQVQNGVYHAWMTRANTGPDGRAILIAPRLQLLHKAVLAACDGADGQTDGLINLPQACKFDVATLQCVAGVTDTVACLTSAEVGVIRAFYEGPKDASSGAYLTVGQPQFGSELAWEGVFVPQTASEPIFSNMITMGALMNLNFPTTPPNGFSVKDISFDTAFLDSFRPLHPLYDATNPDLSAFAGSGGKLILWHGLADPHISPMTSVAYYQAVERKMGNGATAGFSRFYLFPGMYHCGGGEGPNQVDLLTPMVSWVESNVAPDAVLASQPVQVDGGDHGGPMGRPIALPAYPDALPVGAMAATRPIYPYPYRTVWDGKGNPAMAKSYAKSKSPSSWAVRDWAGADLFAPYLPLER